MASKRIEKLLTKYLINQASFSELDELETWIKDPINEKEFINYVKTNYAIEYNLKKADKDKTKGIIDNLIKEEKRVLKIRRMQKFTKYAAVFVVFLGLGYLYQVGYFSKNPEVIVPSNSITLELENGNIDILNEDGTSQIMDAQGNIIGEQKGEQLVYDKNVESEELVYNTLTVPFGKRFQLQLSDGTNVHLNSGTSLKYPVKFIDGGQRQVFLTGEAFFDVASDKKHPFIVNAENLNVEVLGTDFNVSAYPEDVFTDVVLVEGSVGLYTDEKSLSEAVTIEPGTKGRLNKKLHGITTEAVDVSIYTSWMEGGLVFRDMSFENIVEKLERHYNMKIVINNEKLKGEVFNASFKEEPPIEKVLNAFGKSYGIKYTIKNNAIFIN